MAEQVKQYFMHCNDEDIEGYIYTTIPLCPNNHTHTVITTESSSTDSNFFELWGTDLGQTKVAFRTESRLMPIAANQTIQNFDLSFPISICLLSVRFVVDMENVGDYLECILAPDTIIGTITQPISPGILARYDVKYRLLTHTLTRSQRMSG
jgi:hypothetical protein